MKPTISVVIPARNAVRTLGLQLDALQQQEYEGPWEVIVVDNGSTDGTRDLVRSRSGTNPNVRLLTCAEPGANRARNLGVAAAEAPAVLLCDADDEVEPGWLLGMRRALRHHDIVGGKLACSRLNTPFLQRTRPYLGVDGLVTAIGDIPYAVTANMGIRRDVFMKLGGFDESFGTGGDDVDFSLLAVEAGCTIGFAPDAVVSYRLREDLSAFVRQSYQYAVGHSHLYAKHTARGTFPRQTLLWEARLLARQLKGLARGVSLRDPSGRWALAGRAGWLAGSVRGLVRYHAIVTY